jgi:hypothetical protein
LAQIERLVGADNIGRDDVIPLPEVADPRGGPAAGQTDDWWRSVRQALVEPAFAFSATLTNVSPLHAGHTGAGIVIAVSTATVRSRCTWRHRASSHRA